MPFSSCHELEKSLVCLRNVSVIGTVFADDIKFSKMPVENLEDIRLYVLLYVKYAHMYTYITALVCIYGNMCNSFGFRGFGLFTECMVARPLHFPVFPSMKVKVLDTIELCKATCYNVMPF